MGTIADRIRQLASRLSWPKRTPTPPEKKQLGRWESEGGSVHPTDDDENQS